MERPPLISKTAAVENVFSSEDSQQTREVNSSTSRNLPLGTLDNILWTCSLVIWSRILVLAPAGAKTRILDQMTKEHVQRMLSKVPRGRFLEVEEFTSLVCWLSSEDNTFSTAAVFDISGGRSTY